MGGVLRFCTVCCGCGLAILCNGIVAEGLVPSVVACCAAVVVRTGEDVSALKTRGSVVLSITREQMLTIGRPDGVKRPALLAIAGGLDDSEARCCCCSGVGAAAAAESLIELWAILAMGQRCSATAQHLCVVVAVEAELMDSGCLNVIATESLVFVFCPVRTLATSQFASPPAADSESDDSSRIPRASICRHHRHVAVGPIRISLLLQSIAHSRNQNNPSD